MNRPLSFALISGIFGVLLGTGLGIWLTPSMPATGAQTTASNSGKSPALASTTSHTNSSSQANSFIGEDKQLTENIIEAPSETKLTTPESFAQAWRDTGDQSRFQKRWSRVAIMNQWAQKDLSGALEFLHANADAELDRDAVGAVYAVFAEKDINGAIDSLDQWNAHNLKLSAKASILQYLADTDPFYGVNVWLENDPRGFSQEITYAAYQLDGPRLLAQLDQLPRDKRIHAMDSLVAAMAKESPDAAMAMALNDPSMQARQRMINTILNKVGDNDIQQAIALHQQIPGNMTGIYAHQQLIGKWAKDDPEAALAYVQSIDDTNGDAYRSVLTALADTDPQRAWDMALADESFTSQNLRSNVFYRILNQDMELAGKLLESMPDEMNKNNLSHQLINHLAQEDPQLALDYAYNHGSKEMEEIAVRNVINVLANDDPVIALKFAMDNKDIAPDGSISTALQKLITVDEKEGIDWLRQQPDDEFRVTLSEQVIQRLTYQNPDLAQAMLEEFEVSKKQQENIIQNIANAYLRFDTDKAIEYSMKQTNPDAQYRSLLSIFQQLKHNSPQTVDERLAALEVDDATREKLEKAVK